MRFNNKSKPKTFDGTGTKTRAMHTGHGAPAGTSPVGKVLGPGSKLKGAVVMSPTEGNLNQRQTLRKLRGPVQAGAYSYTGANRFVSPVNAATAVVPPPGLGNPRN